MQTRRVAAGAAAVSVACLSSAATLGGVLAMRGGEPAIGVDGPVPAYPSARTTVGPTGATFVFRVRCPARPTGVPALLNTSLTPPRCWWSH